MILVMRYLARPAYGGVQARPDRLDAADAA
jgi:hypothetical protein